MTFRYIINEKGEPVWLLHGNTAVRYINGERVEIPAETIEAKDWMEAVQKIKERKA